MLHSINITAESLGNNRSNIGQIAESLLFYRQVNYFIKEEDLKSLLQEIDLEILIKLVDNHNLHVFYVESHLQLATRLKGKFSQIGVASFNPNSPLIQIIWDTLVAKYGNSPKTRHYIEEVAQRIKIYKHDSDITNKILGDYLDTDFLNDSMQAVNLQIIGNYKKPTFEVIRDSDTSYIIKDYVIQPNKKINNEIGIIEGLSFLLEARERIELGSQFDSEILTNDSISKVIQLSFNRLKRNVNNVETYKIFQKVFVDNAANITTIINNSPNLLNEYLQILEKANKFRTWLDSVDENSDLLSEYYKAVSNKTWLEKGPVKNYKWIFDIGISTILGLLNPLIGIGYSGLSGVTDKIVENRWRPNMFVEKDLRKLLK